MIIIHRPADASIYVAKKIKFSLEHTNIDIQYILMADAEHQAFICYCFLPAG